MNQPIIRAVKQIVKRIVCRPRKIRRMGENSKIMPPYWCYNPQRVEIGERCSVGRFTTINPLIEYNGIPQSGEIILGDDVHIGGYTQIHSMSRLEIGDGSVLSEHVYMSDVAHGFDPAAGLIMKQALESKGPVRIGKNVFIGYGCSVLPGVTLGDHCIVGTRSVVTRSFPAYSMIAGTPARLIGSFNHETGLWEKLK